MYVCMYAVRVRVRVKSRVRVRVRVRDQRALLVAFHPIATVRVGVELITRITMRNRGRAAAPRLRVRVSVGVTVRVRKPLGSWS